MNMTFSQRMLELRRKKGVSQKEAAESLGVSQALLSHYEKGIRECGLDFITRASSYYDVSCDYLLGMSEARRPIQEGFDSAELSLDSEFGAVTLFRAASMLSESFEQLGAGKPDLIKQYFAMSVYSLSIFAARTGEIPKSWISLPLDAASALAKANSEMLARKLIADSSTKQKKHAGEPLCVKTVINEAERIIVKNAAVISETRSVG